MKLRLVALCIFCLPASLGWAVPEGLDSGDNNSRSGAVTFTVPDTLTGTLATDGGAGPTPQDYFKWTATAGTRYVFNATTSGFPALDFGFDIENSAGVSQTPGGFGIDAGGAGQPESYTFQAPASGTYYFLIYRADTTATGASYSVSVQFPASVNDWDLY